MRSVSSLISPVTDERCSIEIGGQMLGIRTAVLEEKATAVEMLCLLCDTLGSRLLPQYPKIIDTILPLLKF